MDTIKIALLFIISATLFSFHYPIDKPTGRNFAKKYNNAIVRIEGSLKNKYKHPFGPSNQKASGTAWFITKKYAITNWHTSGTLKNISAILDGQKVDAKVVKKNKEYDLAVLSIDVPSDYNVQPLNISYRKPKQFEKVFVYGYPYKHPHYSSGAFLTTEKVKTRFSQNKHTVWVLKLKVAGGGSGSPIINQYGKVIGALQLDRKSLDMAMCIPIHRLRKWLKDSPLWITLSEKNKWIIRPAS